MATLKQIRVSHGLRQAEVADKIQSSISDYSLMENGMMLPTVEDMVILEKEFNQRIDWLDTISINEKDQILAAITTLGRRYPLAAVFEFARRALKEGTKLKNPGGLITHYARASQDDEKLLPTGFF